MGKWTGTVLILAGIGLGAYALSPQQSPDGRVAARHAAGARSAAEPATPAGGATQAVAASQPAETPPAAPAADEPAAVPDRPAATQSGRLPSPAQPAPALADSTRRPGGYSPVQLAEAPPRVPIGASKAAAAPPADRAALTREIQRHLKRIGCYQGEVTGVWTPGVRDAMKAFTERVNAQLPVAQPDAILLSMVQNQAEGICSGSCPAGQERAANGRCLPSALVASAKGAKHKTAGTAGGHGQAGPQAAASAHAARDDQHPADPKARTAGAASARPSRLKTGAAAYRPADDTRMSLAGPAPAAATARQSARTRVAPRARAATARPRGQQRAGNRPLPGYSGLPTWAIPFMMP